MGAVACDCRVRTGLLAALGGADCCVGLELLDVAWVFCAEEGGGEERGVGRDDRPFHSASSIVCYA